MFWFSQRAPKPQDFDTEVQPCRDAIEAIIANGGAPTSNDFKDIWSRYKEVLAKHQHEKCGFCEARITSVAAGDVEHYGPKSEVGALSDDASTWGEEEPYSNRVAKTRSVTPLLPKGGYWWLAYEWDNYLFACGNCNQKWKRTLFPVEETPRTLPPSRSVQETPLLLNPYDSNNDPGRHLRFTNFGAVEPRDGSRRGVETIRTCFLDRGSLTRARADDAWRATVLTRRMMRAQKNLKSSTGDMARRELALALDDLLQLGDEHHIFAGMVRIIARDQTRCSWDQLVALRECLAQK